MPSDNNTRDPTTQSVLNQLTQQEQAGNYATKTRKKKEGRKARYKREKEGNED